MLPGVTNYSGWAARGAAAGGVGSLLGQIAGVLDAPRKLAWSYLPGLHDENTGEAYTGEQVGQNVIDAVRGDEPGTSHSPLANILGVGLQTALDPLTFAAGPIAGMVGGRAGLAAARVGGAERAAAQALETAPLLEQAAARAGGDYGTVALGKGYPAGLVRDALAGGGTDPLRKYGGVAGLGSVVNQPKSKFLFDQLERQGYGSAVLDADKNLTGKMLLAGDPQTRGLFAPKGGQIQQLAEVTPEMRGPLAPIFGVPTTPPTSLGEAVGAGTLDQLHSQSPILQAMMGEAHSDLPARIADINARAAAANAEVQAKMAARQAGHAIPLDAPLDPFGRPLDPFGRPQNVDPARHWYPQEKAAEIEAARAQQELEATQQLRGVPVPPGVMHGMDPARGGNILGRAAAESRAAAAPGGALAQAIRGSPLDRLYARLLTKNRLGV